MRRDGSNNVYLVRGSIKHSFVADADRWRDKTIIRFSAPSARRVTLVKETGTTITMERTTDSTGAPSWMLIAPVRHQADANKVDEVINTLARFTCMGWESNTALSDDSLGFVRPKLTARIELDGGSERVVHVGKKVGAENKYWVRSPSHENITFHVGSYTVERLDTSADDLKAALNEEEVS